MTDLDAMHYDQTGKNHHGDKHTRTTDEDETGEDNCPGDDAMWDELDTL